MPEISSLAIVEGSAKLADDVKVGPFSYIGGQVEIAAGCVIDNSVTISGRTVIGAHTHIFPMAVIGTAPKGTGQGGVCVIGEANTIREHVTICSSQARETRIGSDNLIMIGCIVGAGAVIADHGIFDNCCHIGQGARVGDYVRMSGFAAIGPNKVVGAYAFVTGYASVDRDAPPYSRVQGNPIRVRGVNTPNLKRLGFGDDDIAAIKSAFRELFNGSASYVNLDALAKLADDANPHVRRLAEAVSRAADQGDEK